MIHYTTHKKPYLSLFMAFCITAFALMQGCKKSNSEMGKDLAKETGNNVFKKLVPEDFAPVFEKAIKANSKKLHYPNVIANYYAQNNYEPVLALSFFKDAGYDTLANYYTNAPQHGLKPQLFEADALKALLAKIRDKKQLKDINEAYEALAQLELTTANSLIFYTNAMQFGLINPRRIYQRYYTPTARPDSASEKDVLKTRDIKTYLDSIQPKSAQYLALQKALSQHLSAPGMSNEETERYFAVNLERLRWRNKPSQDKFVMVNIPDYRLDVMEDGKSVTAMKVCVGQGRNLDGEVSLVEYDPSDKIDRPFSRETPQLSSMIHSVEVNPVWNIPKSIANKEIMKIAARDPYYLNNEAIDVYQNGTLVENPETIDWSTASADEYSFKQRPGEQNALGRIKFLFKNSSSVYLHDTPAQAAFNKTVRAVSHGCVRLERPEALAEALFGHGDKYKTIINKMQNPSDQPTDIALPTKVPVFITYQTCWIDDKGTIQFRPDVYGLDVVLYAHMKKLLTV